jgi:hypothetical protein
MVAKCWAMAVRGSAAPTAGVVAGAGSGPAGSGAAGGCGVLGGAIGCGAVACAGAACVGIACVGGWACAGVAGGWCSPMCARSACACADASVR